MPLILRFGDEKSLAVCRWLGWLRQTDPGARRVYVVVSPDKSGEDLLDEMAFFIEASMTQFWLNQFTTDVNPAR